MKGEIGMNRKMTTDDKARFLDACPHLLDDIQAIDKALGREPLSDWNDVWKHITKLLREHDSKWKAPEKKLFRNVFTVADQGAEPVEAGKNKGFEPDTSLRDFENVPLNLDMDEYFEAEVRPHVPDAWMDRDDEVSTPATFEQLISSIEATNRQLARRAKLAVNTSLTLRNWLIGSYIEDCGVTAPTIESTWRAGARPTLLHPHRATR